MLRIEGEPMQGERQSRVTLRVMEQFIAVAEELHFHRAADRLNMSQPPLTSAMRKLEDDLGVTLIERGNRVLGLTPAGERFLDEARALLWRAERAIMTTMDVAAGRTGVVRLGYVGSSLYGRLPDVIREFRTSGTCQPDSDRSLKINVDFAAVLLAAESVGKFTTL